MFISFTLVWLVVFLEINAVKCSYDYEGNADYIEGRGERAPLDYGFLVYLYNSKKPNRTCSGAIVSLWWILDNCDDFHGYPYEYFIAGWANSKKPTRTTYKIVERIRHKEYKLSDLQSEKFNADALFATKNAVLLHRSEKEIKVIPTIIRPIKVNEGGISVKVLTITRNVEKVTKKSFRVTPIRSCNSYFKAIYKPTIRLDEKTSICVNASSIKVDACCNSQVFLVSDNILLGLMAWSTGCSAGNGIDPWVFTYISHYKPWIMKHSDVKRHAIFTA